MNKDIESTGLELGSENSTVEGLEADELLEIADVRETKLNNWGSATDGIPGTRTFTG